MRSEMRGKRKGKMRRKMIWKNRKRKSWIRQREVGLKR